MKTCSTLNQLQLLSICNWLISQSAMQKGQPLTFWLELEELMFQLILWYQTCLMIGMHPSSLVVLSSIPLMLVYMWHLDAFNSTQMEGKKPLLLPLENPSFMRNRKERSNQRREEPESQGQLRRRKSLGRISQSQEGHGTRRKKHRLHHHRLIL